MKPAILTDVTKCVGCEACVWACKEINELPTIVPRTRLSAETWTVVEKRHGLNVRRQCMHCLEPACASVCPVGALRKTAEGPVVYDASKCIGCRYCMIGCPFKIPKYDWNTPLPTVKKCILCFEKRLAKGLQPACTAACPSGATIFGDRDALIAEARERIRAHPERYIDHVYGLEEAGGTSVLYLSSMPFAALGFNTEAQSSPYPALTWAVLSKLPNVVSVGGVLLLGFWWLTKRKEVLEKVRNGETTLEEARRENPHLFGETTLEEARRENPHLFGETK
ncbi:MAG: 4Fe-4S dicluster domain-containing protein [Deltaproteobacteria bacterium]|nr:4Fe-4S dicluster domain-containing protein [Deltaproteobacteria bacterium]